jgi:hypothetical protein
MLKENAVTSYTAWVDLGIKTGPIIFGLFVLVVVWYRTGSLHYLVYRIFQALGATRSFHGQTAQRQWRDYEDLQQHNLWHGLRLKTSRHMSALQNWLIVNEMTIEEVCRAKRFFNANELKVSPPTRGYWASVTLVTLGAMAAIAFVMHLFFNSNEALLEVKKTKTWFWVSSGEAHGFGSSFGIETWHISGRECLSGSSSSGLDAWDTAVICHFVLGKRPGFIEDMIDSQKKRQGLLGFYSTFCSG